MSEGEHKPDDALVEPLTRREREILVFLDQGFSAPEIAEQLTLAVSSVKTHIQHIYGKLGVNGKRQALTRAKELGLLGPSAAVGMLAPASTRPSPVEPADALAPEPGESPYQGLRYFAEAEAALFFGREALVHKLLARLTAPTGAGGANGASFLAVVGASGSGKSSLVRAGLISVLRRTEGSAPRFAPIYVITPTAHPLEALAASLTRDAESITNTTTLLDDLARDARALSLHARRLYYASDVPPARPYPTNSRPLLVVDQFEELFTLCRGEAERLAFIDNLMTAASSADGPITVVIAMRADFYPHCAPYSSLREALANQQEYVGQMNADELRQVVERPARLGGWELEPGLVDLILRDVSDEPGGLPLLSHALLETWRHRRGRTLTLRSYAEAGRVQTAIATTAEDVFQSLPVEEQGIARSIFLRLTALGEGTQDTRRRVGVAELLPAGGGAEAAQPGPVASVLKTLSDARLITQDDDVVDVAHEALIREWPTLRQWLGEDRDGLRLHRHLTEAAQEWDELDRDPSELYRGPRLGQALDWEAGHAGDLNPLETEFMAASLAQVEHEAAQHEAQQLRELEAAQALAEAEKRRAAAQGRSALQLRYLVVALAVFLLASSGLAAFAFRQRATAQSNLEQAEQQRLAAQAENVLNTGGSGDLAALLALQSLKFGYTPVADAALLQAFTRPFTRRTWTAGNKSISAVAFSPDGRRLAAGGADEFVHVWDLKTGEEVQHFNPSFGEISSVAFSPDGQQMLVASYYDPVVQLWDLQSAQIVRRLVGLTTGVNSAVFSPTGDKVLTSNYDGAVVWDAQSGSLLQNLGGSGEVDYATFAPDDRYVLFTGDLTSSLLDTKTGQIVKVFTGHTDFVNQAAFSADGQRLVTVSRDGTARLWDVASGAELRRFPVTGQAWTVAISPDGRTILTGGSDSIAQMWDTGTGQEVRRFIGHGSSINSVAFAPDGLSVATGSGDGTVRLWDIDTIDEPRRLAEQPLGILSLAVSPDGRLAVSSGWDATFKTLDLQNGQVKTTFFDANFGVQSAAWSPDGSTIVTGGLDGSVRMWDAQTGRPGWVYFGRGALPKAQFTRAAFSPDGQHVAVVNRLDHTVVILAATMGRDENWPGGLANDVTDLAFAPDGRYLLTSGPNHAARLWDFASGQQVRSFASDAGAVALSPDGRFALTAESDKTAALWEVQTGKAVRRFAGHAGSIYAVAFSPDGRFALTGSGDKTARLWDVATGQEVRQFIGNTGPVLAVAFTRDGQAVLTGGEDGVLRLWRLDYHEIMAMACARLQHDLSNEERQLYLINSRTPTCPN